jgi:uncharacterized membrane protein YhaH (DUF805 family)
MMNLQEATMGDGRDGEGKKRLTKREIRYWGAGVGSVLFTFIVVTFMIYFAVDNPAFVKGSDDVRRFIPASVAIIASSALAIGLPAFYIYLHRLIDEQEESAWLWANTISWYATGLISLVWFILHTAQLVPPIDGYFVLLASALAGTLVWIWKKYF